MLKNYLWEIIHYGLRGPQCGLTEATGHIGLEMFLTNLAAGEERYPLANVHLHWSKLKSTWGAMSADEQSADVAQVRDILTRRYSALYERISAHDRSGFAKVLDASEADETNDSDSVAEKPRAGRKRNKQKEA